LPKESILRKIKENKKLILVFSIIFILVLVFVIGIYFPSKEMYYKKPDPIIASDDVMVIQNWEGKPQTNLSGNLGILRQGYYIFNKNWTTREFYRSWFRFELPEVLGNWEKCVLQIYISQYVCEKYWYRYGYRIYLNETWNETMNYEEFNEVSGYGCVYWNIIGKIYGQNITLELSKDKSFSEYIDNSRSITICFYMCTADLDEFDYLSNSYFEMYSRNSNVDKELLPQLIWS